MVDRTADLADERTKAPGRYHHGDLRQALLQASLELLEESGAGELSLREAARRVGVSHAAPKHHFADKTELLAALAARGFDELTDGMSCAAASGADHWQSLNRAGLAYVRFAVQHPELFRLMFGGQVQLSCSGELKRASERAYAVLQSCARAALLKEGRPEAELELVTAAAWSLVHGMATLWLDGLLRHGAASEADLIELAAAVTNLVVQGMYGPRSAS